jgi:integrase
MIWRSVSRRSTAGAARTRSTPAYDLSTTEAARSALPRLRLHDLRHAHATLLLKERVPIKVVSERLGHAHPGFTMATYQHMLPGMQAAAAQTFATLIASTGFHPVEDPVEEAQKA